MKSALIAERRERGLRCSTAYNGEGEEPHNVVDR